MMTDKRSFEGWQRLSRSVMGDVANDDPGGLAQVRQQLDALEAEYGMAMARLAGACCPAGCEHVHFSHGDIARDLGISRQAVSKRIKSALGA